MSSVHVRICAPGFRRQCAIKRSRNASFSERTDYIIQNWLRNRNTIEFLKQWREANPTLEGNMRDSASVQQLLVLANMESLNAEFIQMGLSQGDRVQKLNAGAIRQMRTLTGSPALMRLTSLKGKGNNHE
jgi:hypothetical protein